MTDVTGDRTEEEKIDEKKRNKKMSGVRVHKESGREWERGSEREREREIER